MRRTTFLLLAALTACACQATGPREGAGIDRAPAAPTGPGELTEAAVRATMHGHDQHGDAMRDAMVRGDLEAAKNEARILTELRVVGPRGGLFRHHLDAMRSAATRVSADNDLKDASRDVAVVAKTCGDCHQAFGRPGMLVGQPGAPAAGVRATMQRHQWAAQQLWEGLVVPSDDAWSAGALVMSEAPLEPEELSPGHSSAPRVGELALAVHDLGAKAGVSDRVSVRADLYGQMLASCADCHKWLGGGPTPP